MYTTVQALEWPISIEVRKNGPSSASVFELGVIRRDSAAWHFLAAEIVKADLCFGTLKSRSFDLGPSLLITLSKHNYQLEQP